MWVCGRILQGNYTLIESFRLLYPGTQCHIAHLKHECNFIIFASSNFAELTLFHIMANGRQKCYAFPEQQENKTLKQKIFPGNSSKIQVAVRKKSRQILVSAVSQREFTFPCLSKLLFKVSVVISKKIE